MRSGLHEKGLPSIPIAVRIESGVSAEAGVGSYTRSDHVASISTAALAPAQQFLLCHDALLLLEPGDARSTDHATRPSIFAAHQTSSKESELARIGHRSISEHSDGSLAYSNCYDNNAESLRWIKVLPDQLALARVEGSSSASCCVNFSISNPRWKPPSDLVVAETPDCTTSDPVTTTQSTTAALAVTRGPSQ